MDLIFLILSTSTFMSLIILLAMMTFQMWPQALSGKTRYMIWIVILLGLIIPFRPLLGNGLLQIEPPLASQVATGLSSSPSSSIGATPDTALSPESGVTAGINITPEPSHQTGLAFSLSSLILLIWGIGAMVSFARHLYRYFQFKKMIGRWGTPITDLATLELFDIVKEEMGLQNKTIRLVKSSSITSPMLTGFIQPTVLLPDKPLADDELELIFKHELTHYKHKDLYINLLATLAISLHWFNPIIYFIYPSIQGDGEVCCDEAVLLNRDLDYRRFYGEVIISMIEKNKTKPVAFSTCFYAKKLNIKRRIFAIMETNKKRNTLSFAAVALFLGLVMISGSIVVFAGSPSKKYIGDKTARTIPQTSTKLISLEAAKESALTDAKLNPNQVSFHQAKLDWDKGLQVYDLEFVSGNTEYDYEIDAATGAIREKDIDHKQNPGNQNNNNNAGTMLSPEQAKAIALANASLKANQVTFSKVKLDNEDGLQVYEVKFTSGNMEYEYEIDAISGRIIDFSKELDD